MTGSSAGWPGDEKKRIEKLEPGGLAHTVLC